MFGFLIKVLVLVLVVRLVARALGGFFLEQGRGGTASRGAGRRGEAPEKGEYTVEDEEPE